MSFTKIGIFLMLIAALAGPCGNTGEGLIAFEWNDGDMAGIYLMRAAGGEMELLVAADSLNVTPSLSPDGRRLAFASNRDGNPNIFVVSIDGTDLRRLTDDPATDLMPAWSPDGERIAFVSDRVYHIQLAVGTLEVEAGLELYTMNVDGSDVQRLTGHEEDFSLYPSWSPDGGKIAYMNVHRQAEIHVVDISRPEEPVSLTAGHGLAAWTPKWSPDGTHILFMGDNGSKKDIYRMEADGSSLLNLTAGWPAYAVDPEWSPCGEQIVFASDKNGGGVNLFIMNADGSDIRPLTQGERRFSRPSWSPRVVD